MAKYILQELEIGEVSLVDKAANKRKFLLLKSEEGGQDMPKAEIILNCEEGMEDILKAIAELDVDQATLVKQFIGDKDLQTLVKSLADDGNDEKIKKAGISDKAIKAVKAALNSLNGVKDELPEDIMKKLATIGGYKMPEEKAKPKPGEEEEEVKKSIGGYTIKKNADGSTDFSDIPEDVRPMVEALWKQNEEAIQKAEAAEAKAEEERNARVLKEFISKAEDFSHLSSDARKLGLLLKAASEKLEPEQYEELERTLKAAEEAAENAEVFKEAGQNGLGEEDKSAYAKLAKAATKITKEEGDKFPTFEIAFEEAIDRNPELAKAERDERDTAK